MCRDMASGFKYLHSKKFLHRDVKPWNVLIAVGMASVPEGTEEVRKKLAQALRGDKSEAVAFAKVSDFGLSTLKEEDMSISFRGTGVTRITLSSSQK